MGFLPHRMCALAPSRSSRRSRCTPKRRRPSALHRFIDEQASEDAGKKSRTLAEAYLLTVKTDYRVQRAYPIALAEDYLESAIRAAPKTRTARDAYGTLQEVMTSAHQDTKGNVPASVRSRLKELKGIAGA